jgi:UDP-glucose 4-epimerase
VNAGNQKDSSLIMTGIAGNLGRLVMSRLHRHHKIIGIDRRPLAQIPPGVVHEPVDMRRKKAQDIFRRQKPYGVVHLGIMHDPRMSDKEHYTWNVVGTENLLDYCAQYGVKKLVMLSSANNYGPMAGSSAYLDEDTPLLGSFAFPGIRDLVAVDRAVSSFFWKHPEIETVILRPVHIAGARLKNAPSNYLRLKAIPHMLGFDPLVQLVHELDVVDAIAHALKPGVRGIFNIVGPPAIPLSKLLHQLGKPLVPVPHLLAKPLWQTFYNLRLSSFPAPEWDFLRYELLVDGSRAKRELGYEAKRSTRDIVNLFRPAEQMEPEFTPSAALGALAALTKSVKKRMATAPKADASDE